MHDDAGARTALAPAPVVGLGSDPHVFAGLYIRHRTSFTAHARRYLRDPRDADEVVQEAFLRLFLALPELETELQALAYCRRTITNLCIDRYRADARRPRLVALEGATIDGLAEDDTGDPVVRAEDAAMVREALSQLPELHRAALVKREIEEKSLPVIAGELDVAEDSVKHLLFRARRALRKLLAGTSVAPGTDAELTRTLRPATRGVSGGAAGLLVLVLLGLGSGPDLRAVPVVGVDLPDVLGVTAVAEAVGSAVRDVVGVIAPQDEAEAAARGQDAERPPATGPQTSLLADGPSSAASEQQAAQPAGSTVGSTAPRYPGNFSDAPAGDRPTTIVTVVDGVPVVTVLPPAGDPPASGPQTGSGSTAPGTSSGRGSEPFAPSPAVPPPAGAPALDAPARPSGPGTSGGAPRVDDAAKAADKAAGRTADAAHKAEQRAAKAADVADKARQRADQAAQAAAEKVAKAAADKAQARAAQRAAAERAAARAAEVAAARAAERAAAAAQAAAAQAALQATAPVEAAATTTAPVPTP